MKNKSKIDKDLKDQAEREELLQNVRKKSGMQLRFDVNSGGIKQVDELKELLSRASDNPDEKHRIYYQGIQKLLRQHLPKGTAFKSDRDLIYDEKNVFLNRGKKKSDNDGVRKSDGRMTYQPIMSEMLDIIASWISTSQNPFDLYNQLYALNEKHGYGHEVYDDASKKFNRMKKASEKSQA